MSFELDHARQEVCFDARTGQRVQADAGAVVCVLDIHTNISMNLGPHKCTAVPVSYTHLTLPTIYSV